MIEQVEARLLLTTETFTLSSDSENVRLFWDSGNNQIGYEYQDPAEGIDNTTDIPRFVPGTSTLYDKIKFVGAGGDDHLTLDLSSGKLYTGTQVQSIEFDGGTGANSAVIENSGSSFADDTISFQPDDTFTYHTNSAVIDNTPFTYDNTVQPIQFQLNGGNNSVVVQGDSSYTDTVNWDDMLFDPGTNSNLSLTVNAKGVVNLSANTTFSSVTMSGSSNGGIVHLQNTGQAAQRILETNALTISGSAYLDVANGELDVVYGTGTDPVSGIRGYLVSGMGTARGSWYNTGDWDGPGINSSAAHGHFPAALGYVDQTSASPKQIRVVFTHYGDTNLDGQVTGSISGATGDGATWSTGSGGKVWSVGDLNYDGNVDSDDAALFGEGLAFGTYAPIQLQAVGTYETRFDVTWNEDGLTNILGYALEYWPGTSSTPSGATTLYVSSLAPAVGLLGNTDNRFGETIASLTNANLSDTDRSAAVVNGTDSSVSANSDYRVMIGAIVGTRTATPYWSDSVTVHTSNSLVDPELQLPTAIGDGHLKIQSAQNSWEPDGLEIRSSVIYHDLWVKRVDDSTGTTTLLPIDHGDFVDMSGSANVTGSIDQPAYLDTDIDFTHQYTYYACLQTGVPSVNAYWQMIPNTAFSGDPYSYKPDPSASNLAAYQTFDGSGNIAVHLTWTVSADDQQNGFDLEWSSDNSTYHAIGGLAGTSRDHVFMIDDAGISPLSATYYFRVKGLAGATGNVITQSGSYSTADLAIDSSYNSGSNLKVPTAAPTGVSETSSTTTSVTLQWTNIGDGDWHSAASNKRYVWIDAATEAGGYKNYYQVPVGDGTNSAVISGLMSGTIYHFILRCVASPGVGYGQSVASTTFTTATIPSNIDSIVATAFSSSLVQVIFAKSSDPDIQYQLQHSTTSTFPDPTISGNVITLDRNQSTYNGTDVQDYSGYYYDDTGRVDDQTYHYQVRAIVTVGSSIIAGAWSTLSNNPTTYPAAPTSVSLSRSSGGTSITLVWHNVSSTAPYLDLEEATNTFALTSGSGDFEVLSNSIANAGTTGTQSYPVTVSAGTQYTFRLAAYDPSSGEYGEYSAYTEVVSTAAPPAPTYVGATAESSTAVLVEWNFLGDSAISSDDVEKQVVEGSRLLTEDGTTISWVSTDGTDPGSDTVDADMTSYLASGLNPEKEYVFTVTPTNNISSTTSSKSSSPTALLPVDSTDSYRLGDAYQDLKNSTYDHFVSVSTSDTDWVQFDSSADALEAGASGEVITPGDTYGGAYHDAIYSYSIPGTTTPTDTKSSVDDSDGGFPFEDSLPADDKWNYVSFYEDTLADVPFSDSPSSGVNNDVIRWSVEDRPTVSVAIEGIVTDEGSTYAEYEVTRSGNDTNALRVLYHVTSGSGESGLYDVPPGVAYIEPGNTSATIKVLLHGGYHVGALTLALDQSDESDASTVGSPYVVGTKSSANDAVITVNTTEETTSDSSLTTLPDAIGFANDYTGGPITITFDPSVFPSSESNTIELSSRLEVTGGTGSVPITIEGPGADALKLDVGAYNGLLFNQGNLSIDGASLTNAFDVATNGAAVRSTGTLKMSNCVFLNNLSYDDGGSVWSSGTLNLTGCAFSLDTAVSGGDVSIASGTAYLQNCDFGLNGAEGGGGLYVGGGAVHVAGCTFSECYAAQGGAIYLNAGTLALTGCAITGNEAADDGGGIFVAGGTLTMAGCTVTGNIADDEGGGIYKWGGTINSLTSDTITGNSAGDSAGDNTYGV